MAVFETRDRTGGALSLPWPLKRAGLSGAGLMLGLLLLFLLLFLVAPLYLVLQRSLQDEAGAFVGLANYAAYFSGRSAQRVIGNTLLVATVSTVLTVGLALLFAFALSRTCMPFKGVFRGIALLPLLTPSLLSAMALTQLFGNQGYLRNLMFGESIYGPIGIVVGMTIAHFPHVFIILSAAIALSDQRLYEAARALRAGPVRIFRTVTLPSIKYGLISSVIVSFTLCLTDFGIPKVIGGQYDLLATEIYKQVVGQQNFQVGAVVSILLLAPAVVAFVLDRAARRRQASALTSKSVPFAPEPRPLVDRMAFGYCALIAIALLAVIAVPGYASFIKFWPYNLDLTLRNYQFDRVAGDGWQSYFNSLKLALLTAVIGTSVIFVGAYLTEKSRAGHWLRSTYQMVSIFPMAVPGLVLGLAYIFFINDPANPLEILYGTFAILVISTIVHYYTVSHLTAVTALRQLDDEFEQVSDSLKAARHRLFFRVTVPICLPAILDISMYLFLSAMTTVSAAVFLYSHDTSLAAIAVINMDDAGEYAAASAMAIVIVATCLAARLVHLAATRGMARRARAWMQQ
ncbi:MAG: phosphonate ABC transporter permease [Alphaproteobacteria bacterium 65-37]|nr:putative 2-aminoethylphosphonate ABC transporter permease subunit [Alphaproteobacteria bacterium]OJU46778.1 MAG: phosphonate ABC transporter permease [Alphaproteobacteria bacterium 65-37]